MKLFYFGSVCAQDVFDETVKKSKTKPSASAQNFELAFIKGLSSLNGVITTVVSAESISTFPGGNRLFLRKRIDPLTDQCAANIVPAVNLPGIKQFNHAHGAGKLLKKWLKANSDCTDKCVVVYGLYPAVAKKLQKLCKKYGCKISIIVADVPSTMFTYTPPKSFIKKLFSGVYRRSAISLQDKFDSYIYLTEAMAEKVAPDKPYTVIETIVDPTLFDETIADQKAYPPAIMYAGALYQKYGVGLILDSFEQINSECELWLFGSGDLEEEIKKRAKLNPKIKFYGRRSHNEILKKEIEATLLLNIRNAKDEYTKFSFPSKMIEYMLSGTPVFTTMLDGIPKEYYSYCYSTISQDKYEIAVQIDKILNTEASEIVAMGNKAKYFVLEQKNNSTQAKKIFAFLQKNIELRGKK